MQATGLVTSGFRILLINPPPQVESVGAEIQSGEVLGTPLSSLVLGFSSGSVVKNPPTNAGDGDWTPGSRRSPGEGNGNPLQYSCLGNPTERGAGGLWSMGSQRAGHNLAVKQQHRYNRILFSASFPLSRSEW